MPRVSPWALTAALTLTTLPVLGSVAHADEESPGLEFDLTAGERLEDGSLAWSGVITGSTVPAASGDRLLHWAVTGISSATEEGDFGPVLGYWEAGSQCAGAGEPAPVHQALASTPDADVVGVTEDILGVSIQASWCDAEGVEHFSWVSFDRRDLPDGSVEFVDYAGGDDIPGGEVWEDVDLDLPTEDEEWEAVAMDYTEFWSALAETIGSEWAWLADVPAPPEGAEAWAAEQWQEWTAEQVEAGIVPADLAWFLGGTEVPPEWIWLDELDEDSATWSEEDIRAHVRDLVGAGVLPPERALAAEQLLTWFVFGTLPAGGDEEGRDEGAESVGPVVDTGLSGTEGTLPAALGGAALLAAGGVLLARRHRVA
ncbi:hypothetical protein [Kytococcus sedentarius]|uniref:hypothetical protein n=1 Tax=Kytococcus sedentarius TaxID=1276 RepID=UPI0035BBE4B0